MLDQALVWIACQLGAMRGTNLATETSVLVTNLPSEVTQTKILSHVILILSTNYPSEKTRSLVVETRKIKSGERGRGVEG